MHLIFSTTFGICSYHHHLTSTFFNAPSILPSIHALKKHLCRTTSPPSTTRPICRVFSHTHPWFTTISISWLCLHLHIFFNLILRTYYIYTYRHSNTSIYAYNTHIYIYIYIYECVYIFNIYIYVYVESVKQYKYYSTFYILFYSYSNLYLQQDRLLNYIYTYIYTHWLYICYTLFSPF